MDKSKVYFLMDVESPDLELDIPNGKVLKKNFVGKNIVNYYFVTQGQSYYV